MKQIMKLGKIEAYLKPSGSDKTLDPRTFFSKVKQVDAKVAEGGGARRMSSTSSKITSLKLTARLVTVDLLAACDILIDRLDALLEALASMDCDVR